MKPPFFSQCYNIPLFAWNIDCNDIVVDNFKGRNNSCMGLWRCSMHSCKNLFMKKKKIVGNPVSSNSCVYSWCIFVIHLIFFFIYLRFFYSTSSEELFYYLWFQLVHNIQLIYTIDFPCKWSSYILFSRWWPRKWNLLGGGNTRGCR